ncbi:Cloroperoxidase [Mycena amicta]|nr:Cloroperoxidase [Mycena amicta]
MSFVKLAFFFFLTTVKLAYADDHRWIAPTATDVRSPCPGLNTLANHGYLPRNGKNLTIPIILHAALQGLNIGTSAILVGAKLGLLSGDAPDSLDLDALALHNLVEHDASLSRGDFALGDNLHFNETIFSTLVDSNPGVDFYNATSAGLVQKERLDISLATNPNVTNTEKEFFIRTVESALYLSVMGNAITGVAPKNFVQTFFREERLPIEEGWKRSNITITLDTMSTMMGIIQEASDWTPTQSCEDMVLGPGLVL